jgi:hypothetical protein
MGWRQLGGFDVLRRPERQAGGCRGVCRSSRMDVGAGLGRCPGAPSPLGKEDRLIEPRWVVRLVLTTFILRFREGVAERSEVGGRLCEECSGCQESTGGYKCVSRKLSTYTGSRFGRLSVRTRPIDGPRSKLGERPAPDAERAVHSSWRPPMGIVNRMLRIRDILGEPVRRR